MPLLPNAEFAIVPIEKLKDYALNRDHPVGKHKAAVFESALGITINDALFLRDRILDALLSNDAILTGQDKFGQRYQMEFELGIDNRNAIILTSWILEPNELFPRMITCYVK